MLELSTEEANAYLQHSRLILPRSRKSTNRPGVATWEMKVKSSSKDQRISIQGHFKTINFGHFTDQEMAASVELPHLVAHVGATVHNSRANLTRIK